MGLNKGKELPQDNFLLIHNEGGEGAEFKDDKSFNISHLRILKATKNDDLEEKVAEEIRNFYEFS